MPGTPIFCSVVCLPFIETPIGYAACIAACLAADP